MPSIISATAEIDEVLDLLSMCAVHYVGERTQTRDTLNTQNGPFLNLLCV